MKKLATLLFVLYTCTAFAQEKYSTTRQFTISGKVKNGSVITMDSLEKYTPVVIGDVNVTNHLGEFKHKDEQLKGVLLKIF